MWIPIPQFLSVYNHPAWYLCACAFHYLMFPFIINFIKKWNKTAIAKKSIMLILFLQILVTIFACIAEYNHLFYDSFVYWFTYKFPITRLLDFMLGCCLGYLYLKSDNTDVYKNTKQKNIYSFIEIGLILVVVISWFLALYGYSYYKHTAVFTLSSLAVIWCCAKSQGVVSRLLSTRYFVKLGNISSDAFLILFIVAMYVSAINRHLLASKINIIILSVITFIITLFVSIIYDKLYSKYKNRKIH